MISIVQIAPIHLILVIHIDNGTKEFVSQYQQIDDFYWIKKLYWKKYTDFHSQRSSDMVFVGLTPDRLFRSQISFFKLETKKF